MQGLTIECQLTGHGTVIRISGDMDSHQCRMLREALDVGYSLAPDSPVVMDLAGVHELTAPGMVILRTAVDNARRAGRVTTVQNLDATAAGGNGQVLQHLLAGAQ